MPARIVRTLAGSARTGFVLDKCAGSIQLSTQTVDNPARLARKPLIYLASAGMPPKQAPRIQIAVHQEDASKACLDASQPCAQ